MTDHPHHQPSAGGDGRVAEGSRSGSGPPDCAVFTPELVQAMSAGFDLAWTTMLAANLACATGPFAAETRRQLALAIVETARRGTRDRVRLSEGALRSFFPIGPEGDAGLDRPGSR